MYCVAFNGMDQIKVLKLKYDSLQHIFITPLYCIIFNLLDAFGYKYISDKQIMQPTRYSATVL